MDNAADEEELTLSATLLDNLETQLRRLIYKRSPSDSIPRTLHANVRLKDLENVIKLIEQFQSDPQLLDPKLKFIVPLIAEAYLDHVVRQPVRKELPRTVDLTSGLSTILYSLCKVRGRKVISGLLNNEPRYLEPILDRLQRSSTSTDIWQIQYVLLLWLSHLLLTPFDLASISAVDAPIDLPEGLVLPLRLPSIAYRIFQACFTHLSLPAASQEVAALAISRLVLRPDMQQWHIAGSLVSYSLSIVVSNNTTRHSSLYPVLGNMRVLATIASSGDMSLIIPKIYGSYVPLMLENAAQSADLDAVGRKLLIKTVRNIVTTASRAAQSDITFESFIQESDVLETTIDYLIQCLSDRETMVRHSAAKALSAIVLVLGPEMGHEIISTMLQSFHEELPTTSKSTLLTANASACHGYTLAIAFALLKRSVSVDQLGDSIAALLAALTFEQRTATGSVSGTGIRDAANFGIWAVARRYLTSELESVDFKARHLQAQSPATPGLIETIAMELLQSACCDPIGNVRRGSSAALQELVGRHPDKIAFGIALVQVVDYQAVGLRRRAMVDVAAEVMHLDERYWSCLMQALLGWRGLGSVDVPARDAAATIITQQLGCTSSKTRILIIETMLGTLRAIQTSQTELFHGIALSLAMLAEGSLVAPDSSNYAPLLVQSWHAIPAVVLKSAFSPRAIKAELPVATGRLLAATTRITARLQSERSTSSDTSLFLEVLLSRSEGIVLAIVPPVVLSMVEASGPSLNDLAGMTLHQLAARVGLDSSKPTLHGAGRVFALAALMCCVNDADELRPAMRALQSVCGSMHVDWRIAGLKALGVVLESPSGCEAISRIDFGGLQNVVLTALADYTIDERGDIGSLVRLQALMRTQSILECEAFRKFENDMQPLQEAVLRLSLEKLTRVRSQAARCRTRLFDQGLRLRGATDVDSTEYFEDALHPLWSTTTAPWAQQALLEGLVACGGAAAEYVLQNVRSVAVKHIHSLSVAELHLLFTMYLNVLRTSLDNPGTIQPTLEFLAFMLQMHLLEPLQGTDFKFRALLSVVQKAHFKSTDVQRILAAVAVYVELGELGGLRDEVLKKLLGMLRSNPYPKVRATVADAIFALTNDHDLKRRDWSKAAIHNASSPSLLQKRLQPV